MNDAGTQINKVSIGRTSYTQLKYDSERITDEILNAQTKYPLKED